MISNRRINSLWLMTALLLGACKSGASNDTKQTAVPGERALHLAYQKPVGYKTECLGRMVFDVPSDIAWGFDDPVTLSGSRFTDNIFTMNNGLRYGEVSIAISYITEKAVWEKIRPERERTRQFNIENNQATLEADKKFLEDMRERLAFDPEYIKRLENGIAKLVKNKFEPDDYDIKLPDAYAYKNGGGITAYLWRNSRIYKISSGRSDKTFEQSEKAFLDAVYRFRPRATFDVPDEPGVCIPGGFFADDGTVPYRVQQTFRVKATPNVTFTIGTGKNGDNTEPIGLEVFASTLPVLSGLGGIVIGQQVQKRIGPEKIKIGPFIGRAGGFTINPDPNGPANQEAAYHIQAGMDGQENSDTSPFVHVQMDGYPQQADRTLKQPAPPFDTSYALLKEVLGSLRLKTLPRALTAAEKQRIADYVQKPPVVPIDADEVAFRQELADLAAQDKKAKEDAEQAKLDAITVNDYPHLPFPAPVDCRAGKFIKRDPKKILQMRIGDVSPYHYAKDVEMVLTYGKHPPAGLGGIFAEVQLLRQLSDAKGMMNLPLALEKSLVKHLCEGQRLWLTAPNLTIYIPVEGSPAEKKRKKGIDLNEAWRR